MGNLTTTNATSAPKARPKARPRARLKGVVFDMDGTLTVPVIDFDAMYRAVLGDDEYRRIKEENPSGIDILHLIESWSPDKQKKAYETIVDFERQGLDYLQIMPGQMTFFPALSREFRPYKPDPAPLLHICSVWKVLPNEVMMIGDSLKSDVACGKSAGAFTCLLDETGRYGDSDYANVGIKPDFKVSSLNEVYSLLNEHFDLAQRPKLSTTRTMKLLQKQR